MGFKRVRGVTVGRVGPSSSHGHGRWIKCYVPFLMSFDRYRCILDRIFSFSKLPKYRCRFRFRKYRTAFVSDKKNVKVKMMESFTDRFRPFSSLGKIKQHCFPFQIRPKEDARRE
jgi:hypothetical protein